MDKYLKSIVIIVISGLLVSTSFANQADEKSSTTIPALSQTCVINAITAATGIATSLGRSGSFVLVDTHGETIASYRMPDALPSTYNFAKSKAETVVALGVSTDKLAKALPKEILDNLMSTQGGKYVIFPGGEPIRINGRLVASVAFGSTIDSIDSNVPDASIVENVRQGDIKSAIAAQNVLNNCGAQQS